MCSNVDVCVSVDVHVDACVTYVSMQLEARGQHQPPSLSQGLSLNLELIHLGRWAGKGTSELPLSDPYPQAQPWGD